MKNKGLSIVELVISIAILGIIMAAVASIFSAAIRNYQVSFTQSTLQRETNIVIDNITRDVKQSVEVPEEFGGENRSATTLFLALPSVDEDENFIYNGPDIEKDYISYYLDGGNIHKTVSANSQSKRYPQNGSNKIVLENVLSLNFIYTPNSPGIETTKVRIEATTSKTVLNTNITVSANSSAVKRNHE